LLLGYHRIFTKWVFPMLQAEAQADRIMESRGGAVLGPFTILKEDYFPGMKSNRLPQTLAGASNFRCMKGNHVYGVAMSTLAGIKNVLREVKQQQGGQQDKVRHCCYSWGATLGA
jgi:hypothetical protein